MSLCLRVCVYLYAYMFLAMPASTSSGDTYDGLQTMMKCISSVCTNCTNQYISLTSDRFLWAQFFVYPWREMFHKFCISLGNVLLSIRCQTTDDELCNWTSMNNSHDFQGHNVAMHYSIKNGFWQTFSRGGLRHVVCRFHICQYCWSTTIPFFRTTLRIDDSMWNHRLTKLYIVVVVVEVVVVVVIVVVVVVFSVPCGMKYIIISIYGNDGLC